MLRHLWVLVFGIGAPFVAAGQIATDPSFGLPATEYTGQHIEIPSGAGNLTGDQLFFSFREFNVPEAGSVTFIRDSGTGSIDTVVSRVTGEQPSQILGAFRSELGERHFYFLNPWGVFFGPDSSLDVGGSFHVSTADEIRAGGRTFSARTPDDTILVARPEAFGFLSSPDRGSLEIQGELVHEHRGATIDLVGSDVRLDGALVWAPGGLVRIAAVGSAGSVSGLGNGSGLEIDATGALGAIEILDESVVSVSGFEPADPPPVSSPLQLLLDGLLFVIPASELQPGDVEIGATSNRSHLAVLRGPATGSIFARADSLLVQDSDLRATSFGANAGSIDIDVDGLLTMSRLGSREDVGLLARSESMPITNTQGFLAIPALGVTLAIPAGTHTVSASGPGADIDVDAGEIGLFDGAVITATTFAPGSGGEIDVRADDSILVTGFDPFEPARSSAIFSNSQGEGNAGSIHVETNQLVLEDGGAIIAQTTANANAGNITIDVDHLEISARSQIDASTSAQSLGSDPDARTTGNGGNILVTARDSVSLSGGQNPGNFGQISTGSQPRSNGEAGSLTVQTPRLDMQDGARISVTTRGAGNSGDITLDVGELRMSDSAISAESTSTAAEAGAAGSIFIGDADGAYPTHSVKLDDSEISAFAEIGPEPEPDEEVEREGNIAFAVSDQLELSGDSTISSSVGTGLGGSIEIAAPRALILRDESTILATTEEGTGGEIRITAESLLPDLALLTQERRLSADAGVGTSGVVTLESPEVDIESQVTPLAGTYLDASSQLHPACAARAAGEGGSFTVSRYRGLPSTPDGWLLAFDDLGNDAKATTSSAESPASAPPQPTRIDVTRANVAFRGGRYEEAESLYGQAAAVTSVAPADAARRSEALQGVAQAQQARGDYAASIETLEAALSLLGKDAEPARRAALLGNLGNAYLALGDAQRADRYITEGLEAAQRAGRPDATARLENHRANAAMAGGRHAEALASYALAAELAREAGAPEIETIARSGAARAALAKGDAAQSLALLGQARDNAATLPADAAQLRLLLHLAHSYAGLAESDPALRRESLLAAHTLLASAQKLAGSLGDARGLSYALGQLGALYASEQRVNEALALTRRARSAAEAAEAPDALAHWHWQEGRLLWSEGRARDALLAYRRGLALLEETRQESLARYGAGTFRNTLAPYYLDFVEALLDSASRLEDSDRSTDATALLLESRITMEKLKAAELRDYFRDECVAAIEARTEDLDRVLARSGERAAIVYPILLPERLELLVTLPSGLRRFKLPVTRDAVAVEATAFRQGLFMRIGARYRPHAQQLYDWLVRPYESLLDDQKIDTLVFVPDGVLRTIPLAALHDGERFLVQSYAVAVTPGLSLVDPAPLDLRGGKILLAGVSAGVQGFEPLPEVPRELAAIHDLYGGEVLLDEAFVTDRFSKEIEARAPKVVHVASHAQFTGDPRTSFVLTYDGKLTFEQLSQVVSPTHYGEQPLELLLLSACETAAGNERAALGLAGTAIRAGARSALGSLWRINDEAARDIVIGFYQALHQPGFSKAKALQSAQIGLLEDSRFQHPFYWSPYLLISNWL